MPKRNTPPVPAGHKWCLGCEEALAIASFERNAATAVSGFKDAVLSKSYLQGLSNAIDAVLNVDDSRGLSLAQSTMSSVLQRLVPLSGQQRQLNDTLAGTQRDAVTFTEQMQRSLVGMGLGLPAKRNVLGEPIDSATLGFDVGKTGDNQDEVSKRLRELGIELSDVKRTDSSGARLSATQLDRLREVRGFNAQDNEGRTMREALTDLLDSEEFTLMGSKSAQQEMVNEVIRSFNKPAREMLEDEDGVLASSRVYQSSFEAYLKEGASLSEADEAAEADADFMN